MSGMLASPGLFVAIFGADGSGKSSVIQALLHKGSIGADGALYMHFRPRLGSRSDPGGAVTLPHLQAARGWCASVSKLFYYLVDFHLGYLLKVRPELARGRHVIFDRYYHDLLIDSRRYRYGGPRSLAHLMGRLVPVPDLSILLDADAEVLWARKREVSLTELRRARQAYARLMASLPNSQIVDASRPLEDVVATVEEIVHAHASGLHSNRFRRSLWKADG